MTVDDVRVELDRLAAGGPAAADVRAEVLGRVHAIRKRRRSVGVIAAAASVAVVIVGVFAVTSHRSDSAPASPPTVSSWDTFRPPTASPSAKLAINTAARDVVSPVTVKGANLRPATLTWVADGPDLYVTWGASNSPQPSGTPAPQGQTGSNGYVVNTSKDIDITTGAPTPNQKLLSSISVSGHPATLTVLKNGHLPPARTGVEADRWISWGLPDGRFIHVWQAYATTDVLSSFAQKFQNGPMVLPHPMTVGLTVSGLTAGTTAHTGVPSSLAFAATTLCPPSKKLTDPFEGDLGDGSCMQVGIRQAVNIDRLGEGRPGETITKPGLTVHFYADLHVAYAVIDSTYALSVYLPVKVDLSGQEVADILSSVHFDRTLNART